MDPGWQQRPPLPAAQRPLMLIDGVLYAPVSSPGSHYQDFGRSGVAYGNSQLVHDNRVQPYRTPSAHIQQAYTGDITDDSSFDTESSDETSIVDHEVMPFPNRPLRQIADAPNRHGPAPGGNSQQVVSHVNSDVQTVGERTALESSFGRGAEGTRRRGKVGPGDQVSARALYGQHQHHSNLIAVPAQGPVLIRSGHPAAPISTRMVQHAAYHEPGYRAAAVVGQGRPFPILQTRQLQPPSSYPGHFGPPGGVIWSPQGPPRFGPHGLVHPGPIGAVKPQGIPVFPRHPQALGRLANRYQPYRADAGWSGRNGYMAMDSEIRDTRRYW